jgi:tetratricopeptide (TPR) repeat protein
VAQGVRDPARAAARLAEARRLVQAQQLSEALEAARQAADADPDNGEAFAYWGVAAAELGRFAEAIAPLQTAAARMLRGTIGWANLTSQLARAYSNVGFWSQAYAAAAALETPPPPDAMIRQRLGAAFARIGLIERGLPHLEWAAAAAPDRAEMHFELALAYLSLGRSGEAEARFEQAIALAPLWPRPQMALSSVKRWTEADAHVERLTALMARPDLEPDDRAALGFSLFKELDDLGRRDEAWPVLLQANEAARALEPPWSDEDDAALVDALTARFTDAQFRGDRPAPAGRTPIFVLGLPRSGTTLVERILAAHPLVGSIGEAPTFPILFRGASRASDRRELTAELVQQTQDADWADVGRRYMAETNYLAAGERFTVDKLPMNSLLIGAIRLAFPAAPIVLLRRNPMDTLLSVFRVQFTSAYRWSARLEDLAGHYALHERLMAHWRAALGEGLIEVEYEALVEDPAAQIRRLLEVCGLGFDPRCLTPHEAEGAVRTASIAQVRRPISRSSVGGWRRYEAGLRPLFDRLVALGFQPG